MNEVGKPEGPRSRGCRFWWKDAIHYDYSGLNPNEKGWTDEDWERFTVKGKKCPHSKSSASRGDR